jgi:hypothetical protein
VNDRVCSVVESFKAAFEVTQRRNQSILVNPGVVELFETEHGLNPRFDSTVILFHDIVPVFATRIFTGFAQTEVELVTHAILCSAE